MSLAGLKLLVLAAHARVVDLAYAVLLLAGFLVLLLTLRGLERL